MSSGSTSGEVILFGSSNRTHVLNTKAGRLKNKKQDLITEAESRQTNQAGKNCRSRQAQNPPKNKKEIQMTKLITNQDAQAGNKYRSN